MEETLIIVTADHAHTLTINGYPARGQNILGLAEQNDTTGLRFETLMYGTGPGHVPADEETETTSLRHVHQSAVHMTGLASRRRRCGCVQRRTVCPFVSGTTGSDFHRSRHFVRVLHWQLQYVQSTAIVLLRPHSPLSHSSRSSSFPYAQLSAACGLFDKHHILFINILTLQFLFFLEHHSDRKCLVFYEFAFFSACK